MQALELTFETLATTVNSTVAEVLRCGLETRDRSIADGALQTALRCKPPALLLELVRRWEHLSERWQEAILHKPGVLTHAIREAFHSGDEPLVRNAAAAALVLGEYELIAFFCAALEDKRNKFRRLAAETIVNLAEKLHDDMHGPRNYEIRRDLGRIRHYVVGALEVAATRFAEHRTNEVLEAFLLLSPHENATLRHLLQDSSEPAHKALCEQLLRSTRPGIANLFFSWLDDSHAPKPAIRLLGQRRDVAFFRQLCHRLANDNHPAIDANLSSIENFPWIKDSVNCVDSLNAHEQLGVVRLVAKSHAPRQQISKLLEHLLRCGEPETRQAALRAFVELRPENLILLLEEQLANGIPIVQAEAVKHLRDCEVPHALLKLLEALNSPHAAVREAARQSLDEFSFARYLAAYENLTPEARRATGALVRRVNPHLADDLLAELRCNGRARRLRALEIGALLEVVPQLEEGLIDLTLTEDHAVRMEATRLLSYCHSEIALLELQKLANDDDYTIQTLALQALQQQPKFAPPAKPIAVAASLLTPIGQSITETYA